MPSGNAKQKKVVDDLIKHGRIISSWEERLRLARLTSPIDLSKLNNRRDRFEKRIAIGRHRTSETMKDNVRFGMIK